MTLDPSPLRWPEALREEWAERSAIVEYDGEGCSRGAAEAMAAAQIRRRVEREGRVVFPAHAPAELPTRPAVER